MQLSSLITTSSDFLFSLSALSILSPFVKSVFIFSAVVAASLTFSATISICSILSTQVMVSALAPFINSSSKSVLLCVSFEGLSALRLACKTVRKFPFAIFLSFAFCIAFSLLCFSNFFLSIFIVYIFAVLLFLVLSVLALFLSALIPILCVFFASSLSNVIVSSVSLSLVSSLIFSICLKPICMFYRGFSQIYAVWCLSRLSPLSTIPSTCGIKLLFLLCHSLYFLFPHLN